MNREPSTTGLEALIRGNTVGLLHIPKDYSSPPPGVAGAWRRHLVANAVVRDREYMMALFNSHFPSGTVVDVDDGQIPPEVASSADNIVLLFPDSIGMDFGDIERNVAVRCPSRRILVLNGRRRFFNLDAKMRRRLALRRFLEATRIPEIVFFLVFVVATPVLVVVDALRGRR